MFDKIRDRAKTLFVFAGGFSGLLGGFYIQYYLEKRLIEAHESEKYKEKK